VLGPVVAPGTDGCTGAAGWCLAWPAGWAPITPAPTPMNDTVAPASVHTVLADASIVNVTGSPEVAVAVTMYVGPPSFAPAGAAEVKLIVCALLTSSVKFWVALGVTPLPAMVVRG